MFTETYLKMIKVIKFIPLIVFIGLFSIPFISKLPFVAHDWPLLFPESRNFSPFSSLAWDYMGNGGVGGNALKTMWIDLYANFAYFISNKFELPWWLSQRIFWLIPFILISTTSSYKFSGLFIKNDWFRVISSIIYTFNTYILLIVAGGQFGIAFAYALAPLALYSLMKVFVNPKLNSLSFSGLICGLLIAMDPRVALLVILIFSIWILFNFRDLNIKKIIYLGFNFFIAGFLNSYWIFPIVFSVFSKNISSTVNSYTSIEGVRFLSFANLENAFSFLHPNWPENIFGKIYFQRPEFLILPILVFGSLIYKAKKEILFLATISLIGIFLSKGTNNPFGEIYVFLFQHLPGFSLFRDSTKFYLLIAISFSILIPYFLNLVSDKFGKYRYLIITIFVCFYLFLLKPGWTGELMGIFKPEEIPAEYIRLNTLLKNPSQTGFDFSRTMWVPRREKYGYFDPHIPAIDSEVLFKGKNIEKISKEGLSRYAIDYVIVPMDTDAEIFLTERNYDDSKRQKVISRLDQIGFLQKIYADGNVVYQTNSYADLFSWPEIKDQERFFTIDWKFINPTEYDLNIKNARKGDLIVFSQGYDSGWAGINLASQNSQSKGQALQAQNYKGLNSFRLQDDGSYKFKIYYKPQKWVDMGLLITSFTFVILAGVLILNLAKRIRK